MRSAIGFIGLAVMVTGVMTVALGANGWQMLAGYLLTFVGFTGAFYATAN
jgi:hypothetical protein